MDELVRRKSATLEPATAGAGVESACRKRESGDERSRTVARLLAVLEQLSVSAQPLSNQDLSEALDVPSSSMHRLLQKLVELGYAEFHAADSTYAIGDRLGELGVRLADAGGCSPPLQRLVTSIRKSTGHTVTVWVPNGVTVRIKVIGSGRIRSPNLHGPGDLVNPFSTPGLAIASQYTPLQLRAIVAQCRRKRRQLGRRYRSIADIENALVEVRRKGYAAGYNIVADGWGMLAWPISLSLSPQRIGALAIGAPVATMRGEEARLVGIVERFIGHFDLEQRASSNAASQVIPFA